MPFFRSVILISENLAKCSNTESTHHSMWPNNVFFCTLSNHLFEQRHSRSHVIAINIGRSLSFSVERVSQSASGYTFGIDIKMRCKIFIDDPNHCWTSSEIEFPTHWLHVIWFRRKKSISRFASFQTFLSSRFTQCNPEKSASRILTVSVSSFLLWTIHVISSNGHKYALIPFSEESMKIRTYTHRRPLRQWIIINGFQGTVMHTAQHKCSPLQNPFRKD